MKIVTLTPTRGNDRLPLLGFCKEQINRQTVQPDNKYFVSFVPLNNEPDITKRIKYGYEQAKKDGMDFVIIVEDDDAISNDHIERYAKHFDRYDFIGDSDSLYYNIHTRRYQVFKHPRRASLFTTAFRVSALDRFKWPADNHVFLDIKLWQHAKKFKCKFINSAAVGIKGHSIGKAGGKGHTMKLRHEDPDLSFFKSKVSEWHLERYREMFPCYNLK
jgi:hypothetical protein